MKNFRTILLTLSFIGMIAIPLAGAAQSYFSLVLPQDFGPVNAKYISQGKTGVANSAGYVNLWTNPAMLTADDDKTGVQVSSSLRRFQENRSFPAIDMFEDKVTDNMYASTGQWYPHISAGVSQGVGGLRFGASFAPVWDMRYDYKEEVRSSLSSGVYNRDPVAGYHQINREGQIYAASLGGAFGIGEKISLGAGYHLLMAQGLSDEYSINVIREDPALASAQDTAFASDIELDGTPGLFTLGLTYDLNWRWRIGANYRSGAEITQTGLVTLPGTLNRVALPEYLRTAGTHTVTTQLPGTIALGVQGTLENPIASTAQFEVHYTDWTQFESTSAELPDSVGSLVQNLQETWEFHVGVEHIILNKAPVRFGFIYAESPLGREFEQTKFTLGGSYLLGNFTLDIGAIFQSLTYNYVDIFPATGGDANRLETVDESNAQVTFTLSYAL